MKNIIIDFGNIISELEKENLNIVFLKNKGIFLEDNQKNLYAMEKNKHGLYLDNLIKKSKKVKFFIISKEISKNIKEWEKEIWSIEDVKAFINRQSKFWI